MAAAAVLLLSTNAQAAQQGIPQPARIAKISKQVFGPRWQVAACIAHYESTDGAWLYNGHWRGGLFYGSLGPWQIEAEAHRWADPRRLISDWLYSAHVAYRLSSFVDHSGHVIPHTGGLNWSRWTSHARCGV